MEDQLFIRCVRFFILLFTITSSLLVFVFIWNTMFPILLAFFLAGSIQPFIRILENYLRLPRLLAVVFIMSLFILLISSFAALLLAELIKGIQFLAAGVPGQFQTLIQYSFEKLTLVFIPVIDKLENLLSNMSDKHQHSILETLDILKEKAGQTGVNLLQDFFDAIANMLASLPTSLVSMLMCILAIFFFSKDWNLIMKMIRNIVPVPVIEQVQLIPKELKYTLHAVIKAQVTLVVISMTIIWSGLTLLKIPYALTITVIAAFVDIIPFIGTGLLFLPWIAYQFLNNQISMAIGLTVIYMLVIITRQMLEPKLLSSHFGIPAIVLFIGLFTGFKLFGMYGLLLSPFIIVMMKTFYTTGLYRLAYTYVLGPRK